MNSNWITALHNAVSALAFAILFSPPTANAYTSNGTDGIFHPADSVILDLTQQIFNFTSIFIPNGVTVSFNGLASSQPIQFLGTGDIYIAGMLDAGANDLWIETPGSIFVPGTLAAAGNLSLVAGSTVGLSGVVTTRGGGDITITSRGGIIGGDGTITGVGDIILSGGGNISITGGGNSAGGSGTITIGGGNITFSGGGDITITDESGCSEGCLIPSAVPEPDVWAMFLIGLCGLFAVSRLRNPNLRPA